MDKASLREAQKHIGDASSLLETIKDDLSDEFDEKTEDWQDSDAGQAMQEKIEAFDDLISRLNEIDSEIEAVMKGE